MSEVVTVAITVGCDSVWSLGEAFNGVISVYSLAVSPHIFLQGSPREPFSPSVWSEASSKVDQNGINPRLFF